MITAKEASELYNGNLLLRDKYIEEVVEPLIKEKATTSKAVSLAMRGVYMCEPSIDFPSEYGRYNINIELTEEIIKTLRENGYKVDTICALGSQEYDGKGELTISWD